MMSSKDSEFQTINDLIDIANGFTRAKSLHVAAELDIASHLKEGRKSAFDIAKTIGCNGEFLYRLMRALTTMSIFHEEEEYGYFTQTEHSKLLLNENVRNIILLKCNFDHYRGWENFLDTVKTGSAQPYASLGIQGDYWDYMREKPEEGLRFRKGMSGYTNYVNQRVVATGDFKGFDTVCDIGGSQGVFIQEILRQNPTIKTGINFDLPYVCEKNKLLERQNIDPRFKEVEGSFFEAVPPANLYTIKRVLHDWNDEHSKKILTSIHKAMLPGGKVYIFDAVLDTINKNCYNIVAWMDLSMMQLVSGKERSEREWEALVSSVGFKIEKVIKTQDPMLPPITIITKI
ncbi:O-methyltransferase family 2 protein [Cavenderia fasciculata]|uniref:O-methyltransferase family 2 protein n=1 Tax=Cavenderia fasciculata TaxID=261658 RepID=F4PJT0_CACFS|nr:O-methyltransferase family 2 protein [Cavenderia fasciculata]EGG23854.1 O-methyltransferase family 2 protein [Cavenderia fasciculata]|eukprot:XP_004361705.1 O-methyltransferase family 2 protein [Cavenderia fasciculata]